MAESGKISRMYKPKNPELDAERRNVLAAMNVAGVSLNALSLAIPRNPAYMWKYFELNTPAALPERVRERVAEILGVDAGKLRGVASTEDTIKPLDNQGKIPVKTRGQGGRGLPVIGRAIAGTEYIMLDNGRVQGFTSRPGYLEDVEEAYALEVNGESMVPRYISGEMVEVNPLRSLASGCFVAVDLFDDTALIKQFVRFTDRELVLRQLNPEREITIERSRVRNIHRITGSHER